MPISLSFYAKVIIYTINFLNIRTPKKFIVITLKFLTIWLYHRVMSPNDAARIANSVDPDQTAPLGAVEEQSDLGLHCLPRHICPKT